MQTQTLDATIVASSHPDIVKRVSVSGLIVSAVMLLIGVLAFVLTFELEDHSSTMSMALMVLGSTFVLIAIFRLFWKSKEVVYLPTGSVTKGQSVFFDLKHMEELKVLLEKDKFSTEKELRSESGGNIRLDVMLSGDNKFAAAQLFQFVPYTYNPITSVHYFTQGEASALASFLMKSKLR